MLQTEEDARQGVATSGLEDAPPSSEERAAANGAQQPPARRVTVTDSAAAVGYANFCAVQRAAEEVLLDFGISGQRFGQPQPSIQITHRLALTYATAKRLLDALRMAFEPPKAAADARDPSGDTGRVSR